MTIQLLVGLGNPGSKYESTRHNAGFWFIDELARHWGGHLSSDTKFHCEMLRIFVKQVDRRLIKPQTFMNLSGKSVAAVANFYKIPAESILVVHDELDLLPGKMKLKIGGSHGGHNGLKDIQAQLGTPNFWRLRIGIGHPGHRDQVVGFVLTNPPASERTLIDASIRHAVNEIDALLDIDPEKSTQRINAFTAEA